MEKVEHFQLHGNDFLLFKQEGKILHGGFSPHWVPEKDKRHWSIPAGLFHATEKKEMVANYERDSEDKARHHRVIDDHLFEKLMGLASVVSKKKKPRSAKRSKREKRNTTKKQ